MESNLNSGGQTTHFRQTLLSRVSTKSRPQPLVQRILNKNFVKAALMSCAIPPTVISSALKTLPDGESSTSNPANLAAPTVASIPESAIDYYQKCLSEDLLEDLKKNYLHNVSKQPFHLESYLSKSNVDKEFHIKHSRLFKSWKVAVCQIKKPIDLEDLVFTFTYPLSPHEKDLIIFLRKCSSGNTPVAGESLQLAEESVQNLSKEIETSKKKGFYLTSLEWKFIFRIRQVLGRYPCVSEKFFKKIKDVIRNSDNASTFQVQGDDPELPRISLGRMHQILACTLYPHERDLLFFVRQYSNRDSSIVAESCMADEESAQSLPKEVKSLRNAELYLNQSEWNIMFNVRQALGKDIPLSKECFEKITLRHYKNSL